MLLKFLKNKFTANYRFSRINEKNKSNKPRFKLGNGYYLDFDEVSNGMGGYRKVNVRLLKTDDPFFRRYIVDERGRIQYFPGIKDGDWKKDMEFPLDHTVRFGFHISGFQDGKALVSWTLQPDGRYFEDEDGFGAEHYLEITLYSHLNEDGKFTEPFYYKE